MVSAVATRSELDALVGELDAVASEARREFGALSARQLNWKPSADEWSVGQCLEHLMKTNEGYFPRLEQLSKGEQASSAWERLSPLSKFWGRTVLKFVAPGSARKVKARPGFLPSSSELGADMVERFVAHQRRLTELMRGTGGLDLERVVVTSPISGVVTYSLLDAYRIVVAHEQRHMAQARRVTQSEGFPK